MDRPANTPRLRHAGALASPAQPVCHPLGIVGGARDRASGDPALVIDRAIVKPCHAGRLLVRCRMGGSYSLRMRSDKAEGDGAETAGGQLVKAGREASWLMSF